MAMIDVGSRIKSLATLIGEEEGDHDDDRDTFNTPSKYKTIIPRSNDCAMNKATQRASYHLECEGRLTL